MATKSPGSGPSELYTPESWEEARRIAALIGQVPSAFTSCIHFMKKDLEHGGGVVSSATKFSLGRLLKSPTLKSPLYFGARSFIGERLAGYKHVSDTAFIELYGLDGLMISMGLLYLYKRLQAGCDEQEWSMFCKQIHVATELGAHLGHAIPAIGMPLGLMLGGIRNLGLAMFLGIDKKGFSTYRRKYNKGNYDVNAEYQTWGCNHLQIAALLLQALGIGVTFVDALLGGMDPTVTNYETLDSNALKVKIASIWLESLLITGKPPEITHLGKFYPLKEDMADLLEKTGNLRKNGSTYSWLGRTKEDIDPRTTPQLFIGAVAAPPPVEEGDSEAAEVEQALEGTSKTLGAEG